MHKPKESAKPLMTIRKARRPYRVLAPSLWVSELDYWLLQALTPREPGQIVMRCTTQWRD